MLPHVLINRNILFNFKFFYYAFKIETFELGAINSLALTRSNMLLLGK